MNNLEMLEEWVIKHKWKMYKRTIKNNHTEILLRQNNKWLSFSEEYIWDVPFHYLMSEIEWKIRNVFEE